MFDEISWYPGEQTQLGKLLNIYIDDGTQENNKEYVRSWFLGRPTLSPNAPLWR